MRRVLTLAVLLGVGLIGVVVPTASAAPEPPGSNMDLVCSSWNWGGWNPVYSCYDQRNDDMWVYDGEPDHHSAVVLWTTTAGNSGQCRNANQAGTWKRCDYEFSEWLGNGSRNRINWNEYRYDAQYDSLQLVHAPAGSAGV